MSLARPEASQPQQALHERPTYPQPPTVAPLLVAISTSGESPFLAAALRRRLEAELDEEWREFVRLVGEVRRDLRRRGVSVPDQTRLYERLLDSSILDLLRQGAVAAARREIARFVRENELVNR